MSKKTILLVDDDLLFARKLGDSLQLLDCDATVTNDPTVALKAVESMDLILAVINYDLPDLSGLEVLRAIKKRDKVIPVIMVSTNPDRKVKNQSMEQGADEFYLKQSDFQNLLFSLYRKMSSSK